ncbi:hypothetical protein CEXT_363621 [Caerostris extrusa]|uniref:Uncharacterized protein n=1 Tax=Caerostris extrusa TaxID=172846 RepID=A0AAV4XHC8_CAEEX|nr:hypothetical protein CEXT_363621 [Caerostris extrusa]
MFTFHFNLTSLPFKNGCGTKQTEWFRKATLTLIETFLTTVSSETSISSIKNRLVELEEIFSKILEYESTLSQEQSEMVKIKNGYFDAKGALRKLFESTTRDERTMDSNSSFLNESFRTTTDFRMPRLNMSFMAFTISGFISRIYIPVLYIIITKR